MIWWWRIFFIIICPMFTIGLGTLFGKIATFKTTQNSTLTERHRKTITFDKFLEFYKINPNKWITFDFRSSNIEYDVEYILDNKNIALYWETKEDRERYRQWIIDQTIQELNKKDAEEYQLILEDIQKDVKAKMDAIQKEREAELIRIEEERKKNQSEYNHLMNEIANISHKTNYSGATNIATTNKIYIHTDTLPIIKENNNIIKLWDNRLGYYFEADCGIPYIKTIDGKILEVEIIE